MACDTLGGWRPDERQYRYDTGDQLFDSYYGAIKFEIHPDDNWKVDQNAVKLGVFNEDYCMG
eukprot:CAMPEP_0197487820 /NCGR_PEP_ID=MMETSP1311-20131121/2853_1 /TAXON_ID=464262 /ORGANISM="Genus nov. species nov., Strain RCC856" /LENGTH=61 /DNA_ID=CAMNT_0043031647 /DNA_START=1 /DNA_END=182 /DNA_ORIENTATION=+